MKLSVLALVLALLAFEPSFAAEKRRPAAARPAPKKKVEVRKPRNVEPMPEQVVNLDTYEETSETAALGPPRHHGSGAQPIFKFLFDLVFAIRPGANPWTFDNYHTLALVDIIPRQGFHFSFELNPTPRYYELDVDITDRLRIRAGRIWIPFDDMNPHNSFGGYINTSLLRPAGTVAFLPDIWADLGVGARFQILDTKDLSALAHLYVVNGFGAGGADPTGAATSYPDFAALPSPDANTDKAIGGRVQMGFLQRMLSVGASFYTGRYTPDTEGSSRILMLGLDAQVRPLSRLEARAGYTFGSVGLPAGGSFNRAGFYAEGKYKLLENWFASIRLGLLQGDNRVTDANDQNLVGGRAGYEADWYQLSVQYMRDLKDVAGKRSKEFTVLRFLVML